MNIDLVHINYLAVLVGVIINMAGGALWYSPILFAKPWMAETGIKMEDIRAKRSAAYRGYAISIVASIIIAFVLAILAQETGAHIVADGLILGSIAGVGFVATTSAANYSFESRPLKLYLINVGYSAVSFLLIGIVVALWDYL